jgi:hypothetical protein
MQIKQSTPQKPEKPLSYRLVLFAMGLLAAVVSALKGRSEAMKFAKVAAFLGVGLGLAFAVLSLFGYGVRSRGTPIEFNPKHLLLQLVVSVLAILIAWVPWLVRLEMMLTRESLFLTAMRRLDKVMRKQDILSILFIAVRILL